MTATLAEIHRQIATAARQAGRDPASIKLLAVSKGHMASELLPFIAAGQIDFGENYVQEALPKIAELVAMPLSWHFIGPIQQNKTKSIAQHFSWVHSVDRLAVAKRLSEQRPLNLPPLNICLQVNIDMEPQKAGVAPQEVQQLAMQVLQLPRLALRGLMAIPAAEQPHDHAFTQLQTLYVQLQRAGIAMDTLSMGMSADFPAAIAAGATIIRIGTALFGSRK